MDILAHGLWTGVVWYRRTRAPWLAVIFGMIPDLPWLIALGFNPLALIMGQGLPPLETLPPALVAVGLAAHSFAVFAVVAGFVWLMNPRLMLALSAWAGHIIIDIFSHADVYPFTSTKFLYPLSDFGFSVVNWNQPVFLGLNYTALAVLYVIVFRKHLRRTLRPFLKRFR
ncbi:hypothetical protein HYW67_01510 [Candidatus Parcubacteria bacterium]|nr:hypothetical protein [Candidatus Parcubacteria bacterium]